METTLNEAEKELNGLKLITLGVFSNNPAAIKMYQNFGFKEFFKAKGSSGSIII